MFLLQYLLILNVLLHAIAQECVNNTKYSDSFIIYRIHILTDITMTMIDGSNLFRGRLAV